MASFRMTPLWVFLFYFPPFVCKTQHCVEHREAASDEDERVKRAQRAVCFCMNGDLEATSAWQRQKHE